jgi:hypothetical protein
LSLGNELQLRSVCGFTLWGTTKSITALRSGRTRKGTMSESSRLTRTPRHEAINPNTSVVRACVESVRRNQIQPSSAMMRPVLRMEFCASRKTRASKVQDRFANWFR